MNPIRTIATVLMVSVATALMACAPIRVTSFTERGVDVGQYRTFAWDRIDTAVPGDPRLDNNPFFHEYLRGAIDRQLVSRGYEPTMLQPDVRVHYHASSKQKIYTPGPASAFAQSGTADKKARHDGSGTEPVAERCRDCAVEVYDEGTLLVDVTDGRTGALLWRGVAESGFADVVNRQPRMEETIDDVVERVFARLPRSRVTPRAYARPSSPTPPSASLYSEWQSPPR